MNGDREETKTADGVLKEGEGQEVLTTLLSLSAVMLN